jgi:transposase
MPDRLDQRTLPAAEHKHIAGERIPAKPLLYLQRQPPSSPDLNPIEQVFAKLKTQLCKVDARSVEDTWKSIGKILEHFHPVECANYLVNAGYTPT